MKKTNIFIVLIIATAISLSAIYIHSETNKTTTLSSCSTTTSSLKSLEKNDIVKIKIPVDNNDIPAWILITPKAQTELNKAIKNDKNITFNIVVTGYG